jgi:catechol 2,3-dioxygenase-like lactoylglutathione lyase family enzyme
MTCTTVMTYVEWVLDDIPAAARFFRHVLALPVRHLDLQRAEVRLTPGLTARLVAGPPRPILAPRDAPGPLLELQVAHVGAAVAELRRRGATILVEPVLTDWGTESAFVAGPGDLLIELYRAR